MFSTAPYGQQQQQYHQANQGGGEMEMYSTHSADYNSAQTMHMPPDASFLSSPYASIAQQHPSMHILNDHSPHLYDPINQMHPGLAPVQHAYSSIPRMTLMREYPGQQHQPQHVEEFLNAPEHHPPPPPPPLPQAVRKPVPPSLSTANPRGSDQGMTAQGKSQASQASVDHHFDSYFNEILSDIQQFLDHDVLNVFQSLFSMSLCPLQTPVNLKPHHRDVVPVFQQLLGSLLERVQKKVDQQQAKMSKINLNEARAVQMPSLQNLHDYAMLYQGRAAYVPHIQTIITAFQNMQAKCTLLWSERMTLHGQMKQEFEQTIRKTCSHTTKLHLQICPELHEYISTRRQKEQIVHQEYARYKSKQCNLRHQFYIARTEWIGKQTRVLRDMLTVVEAQLLQPPPKEEDARCVIPHLSKREAAAVLETARFKRAMDYEKSMQRFRDLKTGLSTWEDLYHDHVRVDNHFAILPELLFELQCWLLQFEYFFMELIGQKIPDDPKTAFPLAPVQVLKELQNRSLYTSIYTTQQSPFERLVQSGCANGVFSSRDMLKQLQLVDTDLDDHTVSEHGRSTVRGGAEDGDEQEDGPQVLGHEDAEIKSCGRARIANFMIYGNKPDESAGSDRLSRVASQFNQSSSRAKPRSGGSNGNNNAPAVGQKPLMQQRRAYVAERGGFMGLADLLPEFKEFFQHTHASVTEDFLQNQQRHQRLVREQDRFNKEMEQVLHAREEFLRNAHRFVSPDGALYEEQMVEAIQNDDLHFDSPQQQQQYRRVNQPHRLSQSASIELQCQLAQRAQQLNNKLQILEMKFMYLMPRLDEQYELVESLNRVLEAISLFGTDHAQEWVDFIEQEREFTQEWKQVREEYHTRYLVYRTMTRQGMDLNLLDFRQQLSLYFNMTFLDLKVKHEELMKSAQTKFEGHRNTIAQARKLVDFSLTAVADKLEGVPGETEAVTLQMDEVIRARDTLHRQEYDLEMQRLLVLFVESIKFVLDKLLNEPSLHEYLKFLDEVCVEDHKHGSAPCPKTVQRQLLQAGQKHNLFRQYAVDVQRSEVLERLGVGPLAPQNWIQLVDYPRDIDTRQINSESEVHRSRTHQAHSAHNALGEERTDVQSQARKDVALRTRLQQFKSKSEV